MSQQPISIDQLDLPNLKLYLHNQLSASNYAELRALTITSNSLVYVGSNTTLGDGGEGYFYAVTGATIGTYTDNGGTIILPTGGDGSAAWIRYIESHYDVRWFGAAVDGITNDYAAIQTTIDVASTGASSTQNRSATTVFMGEGDYRCESQIVIKAHVNLHCEGLIHNYMANLYTPLVVTEPGSHVSKLQIYGHGGSGVQFGTKIGSPGTPQYMNSQIGDVRLLNIGETYIDQNNYSIGILFVGYDFTVNSLEIDGGNVSVDFSSASDVRIGHILAYSGSTGLRISAACEHIGIDYLDIDTPAYLGMQIDSAKDISIGSCTIFINDQVGTGAFTSGYGIDIGNFSSADPITGLYLNARVLNTGGTALRLANISNSNVHIITNQDALYTGGATPVTIGVEYGTGVTNSVRLTGTADVPTPILGMVGSPAALVGSPLPLAGTVLLNSIMHVTDSATARSSLGAITNSDYATSTTGGTVKMRISGTTLYITNDGTNA